MVMITLKIQSISQRLFIQPLWELIHIYGNGTSREKKPGLPKHPHQECQYFTISSYRLTVVPIDVFI